LTVLTLDQIFSPFSAEEVVDFWFIEAGSTLHSASSHPSWLSL